MVRACYRCHRQPGNCTIVTTEEVLAEFLAAVSRGGEATRALAAELVRDLIEGAEVTVFEQSHASFLEGLTLYEQRLDKAYSLVDCISMACMRRQNTQAVLTHDRHFEQEGFAALMRG